MNVLGLYGSIGWDANKSFDENGEPSWTHDSGATLFMNGKHVCSISEERLTRIKYDGNYPQNSIDYCLNFGGISYDDIDEIAIPSFAVKIFYDRLESGELFKFFIDRFPNAEVKVLSHHLCHSASSVFTSNFNEGSFFNLDGAGSIIYDVDNMEAIGIENCSMGYFNKSKNIFRFFNYPPKTNEFGLYYWQVSGFIYAMKTQTDVKMMDERTRESLVGKIMGLSAYGDYSKYDWKKYKISKYYPQPYACFDHSLDYVYDQTISPEDTSSILQKNYEEGLLEVLGELKNENYFEENICFSGGCFLNILGNTLIKQSGMFKNIHIPPFTNDTGLHFGAACYSIFKQKEKIEIPKNISLFGKEYSKDEILNELEIKNLPYKKYDSFFDLCFDTANYLKENKIIGWFQGRSEFGPRALGSRSILMSPSRKYNKDIINSRIKHREYWRPFAGIILEEYISEYFEDSFENPYMLYSQKVKKEKENEISAIVHKDKTCRIQTVGVELNSKVTELLQQFYNLTGTPVLLNTSFNDNGEPIVETPKDAINSFLNLDIDYLIIDDYIVSK